VKNRIKTFVEAHPELVSVKDTSNPELRVLKYKNKVFYKNLWTPEITECRGTVIDKNWDIVSRPFTKIYNYGESNAPEINDDEEVVAVQKINGFMGAITMYNGELLYSTTGTIDSEYAEKIQESVEEFCNVEALKTFLKTADATMIAEICRDDDKHIIRETPGVYLLALRPNHWGSTNHASSEDFIDKVAVDMNMIRPEHRVTTFGKVKELVKKVKHEGFVIYSAQYPVIELKIKSPYYLTTKFLSRMGVNKVDLMYNDVVKFKEFIDEEYYDIVEYIVSNIPKGDWENMSNLTKVNLITEFFEGELSD